MLYPNDADGNAIRANLAPALAKAGFTIVDPGPYEDGTTDYSAQIAMFKEENVRDLQHLPDPAGLRRVLAPGRAAGLHQDGEDRADREDRPVPERRRGARRSLGYNLSSAAYWHKAFPYKSSLTGVSGDELADGYEKASGKQWTQQLGASLSLLDAGFAALKASGAPSDKAGGRQGDRDAEDDDDRRQGRFHQRARCRTSSPGPIIGTQWVKAPAGSKFKLDYVVTDHATDPNVPVAAKLVPFNG